MQFGKMMRIRVVVVGLGVAFLCAGATKAQEIVNSTFDDGPNVEALAPSVTAPSTQPMTSTGQAVAPQAPVQTAEPASETESNTLLWFGASLVWLGAIGMYFSGPAKRFALEMHALRESYKLSRAA